MPAQSWWNKVPGNNTRYLTACILLLLMIQPLTASGFPLTPTECLTLEREKWSWQPFTANPVPPFLEMRSSLLREPNLTSCRKCLMWIGESAQKMPIPEDMMEPILFQKAKCYRALNMRRETIEACRNIFRNHPDGPTELFCQDFLLEALFQDRNYEAIMAFYSDLPPETRERLHPESLYVAGQAFYLKGRDEEAWDILDQVPLGTQIHAYARYTLAQIAYRRGERDQAAMILAELTSPQVRSATPPVLADAIRLTYARVLFQEERYQESLEQFKKLRNSELFLADALVGMAWCARARGDPARAIAYLQSVGKTRADTYTMMEAQLDMGRAYSQAGAHEDAFEVFKNIQNHLHLRIGEYEKYSENPKWLGWLAEKLLAKYRGRSEVFPPDWITEKELDLHDEIFPVLEKQLYLAPRMKRLGEIQKTLDEVSAYAGSLPGTGLPATDAQAASSAYPPLETRLSLLDSHLPAHLDFLFAVLDTEYRLMETGVSLGLFTDEEERVYRQDSINFYDSAFRELIWPGQTGQDADTILGRLQSTVRNLPFSLEEKETLLAKIRFTRRMLEESEETLGNWTERMRSYWTTDVMSGRLLYLREWMVMVRTLMDARSWIYRAPAVFLVESPHIPIRPPSEQPTGSADVVVWVEERIQTLQDRLQLLTHREIHGTHQQRLQELEALLNRTQLYYAEAILMQHEEILQTLQAVPNGEESTGDH